MDDSGGGQTTMTWLPSGRRAFLAAAPVVVAAGAVITLGPHQFGFVGDLPRATYYLSFSFVRMVAAYAMSLAFALVYGYFASSNRGAERVMIPILDILQSVPILAFFGIALLVFVQVFQGIGLAWVGYNLASIFLIFTSMAWNMVFGVYESLKSIPGDLREAADSFNVRGWQRVRQLLIPATLNRLVYNSVLSWTGGWFFLVAAELIGGKGLPGIGSYLLTAAGNHNGDALVAGLVVLIVLIALLDLLVWRPLGRWAEKYRYDTTPSGDADAATSTPRRGIAPLRRAVTGLARIVRTGVITASTPLVSLGTLALGHGPTRRRSFAAAAGRYIGLGLVLVMSWLLLIYIGVAIYSVYVHPLSAYSLAQIQKIPYALGSSAGRLVAAYLISLAISFPLALLLTRRPRAARIGLPLVEIVASVPATAVFPLIVFILLGYFHPQFTSILMLTTGMIWYLFFNLLSGMRALPPDLDEAARSFGVRGWPYYRRVLLPAVFPAFITGSITAFGGGWNTLIVAEYLSLNTTTAGQTTTQVIYQVPGIGQLLDAFGPLSTHSNAAVFGAALITLVVTVIVVNELVWKPMYRRAIEKYRYD
jgi:NitT/TauT family transport system permease protein